MKGKFHRLLSLLMIMSLVVISLTKDFTVMHAQASVTSEELSRTYLNVICKYLYLGEFGKNKFNFNINKEALQKGATYSWYIKADKGNPKAITIDSKTGIVTAKSVGTAYIRCKITFANKVVLRPEAKVIVRNNITGVEINNIPEAGRIAVGSTMDFNRTILNTEAGSNVKSTGITCWEIAKDTAGVGSVTDKGVVTPKKVGGFSIRAICFRSMEDYKLWLCNKRAYADAITATSDWVKIKVYVTDGEAATQEQLKELLVSKEITQITLSTDVEQKIVIPEGDYSNKTLVVKAPKTNITNFGTFKLVTIKSASSTTWEENAINNNLVIHNSAITLLVTDKAQVKSLELGKDSNIVVANNSSQNQNTSEADTDIVLINTVYLTHTGKIEEFNITTASKLILTGSGSVGKFTITESSKGTKIATSVPIDVFSYADYIITLLIGAEGTDIHIPTSTTATIENLAKSSIDIYTRTGSMLFPSGQAIFIPSSGTHKLLGKICTSSVVKLTPSVVMTINGSGVTSVTGSAISMGQELYNSNLSGTFTCYSTSVAGNLSWVTPLAVVNKTGDYAWIFTPLDTSHYNIATGVTKVTVIE